MGDNVELIQGDLTKLKTDAIVNAANTSLLGGGGVDGAIHRAAGPKLLEECKKLRGCPTGEARISKGYDLPARFIIHAVGPVWQGGHSNEKKLLENAYRHSLFLCQDNGLHSVAFPNISTGIYGFPKDLAAQIAIKTVRKFQSHGYTLKVIFACFDEDNYRIYQKLLAET